MKTLMLLAAACAALSLAACDRSAEVRVEDDEAATPLRTIAKLDCPEKEGDLQRVSVSADGLTCAYKADGAEVTLRLVALTNGDVKAALDPIEAELKGIIPAPAKPAAPATPATPATNGEWNAEDSADGGKAEVNMPGIHIKADDGEARINIGGISIDAGDNGAKIRVGEGTTIDANDQGAEIRTAKTGDAVRSTYILASDKATGPYKVVGYEARGPKAGPIVVAVVKAAEGNHQRDLFKDMKKLVERNVGE